MAYISPWWWRQYGRLKRRYASMGLHGAISQKAIISLLAAVGTWNLTQLYFTCYSCLGSYPFVLHRLGATVGGAQTALLTMQRHGTDWSHCLHSRNRPHQHGHTRRSTNTSSSSLSTPSPHYTFSLSYDGSSQFSLLQLDVAIHQKECYVTAYFSGSNVSKLDILFRTSC
jgi:hypothetical protein